jgi:lipopolysaccharide/colanic/teichoic acid biosynthesis glycosyltransferase
MITKRIIDVLVSALLITVLSPLYLLLAVLVKLSSPGPALFKPVRAGRGGIPFTMYKFRSMRVGGEKDWLKRFDPAKIGDFVFQAEDDPRITAAGRFLRKTSLDELPNLFNVLGGSMSLVGPRPEEPEVVEHYTPEMRRRLDVKPGLTGLAQISGRGELPLREVIAKDIEYVDRRSFWLDLNILIRTPFTVFSRRGAL